MEEEMFQMVDDDEIENVGIMSGFMDDLEELMSELDVDEMGSEEEADMAKMMSRTPDSPEILMNNLRGDIRSVDARREELADMVGMREAEETPEGVLTLLQSVLAQEEAAPPMPMAPPMPPPGMPPPGMPPEMMGGMPPQGMPPPMPQGVESISVDETIMPAMAYGGPVQNFNRGSGQMGVTPATDAFAAYPSDVVQEAQRRVRHMVDGGMVQNYNQGGAVQYYQDGSTPEAVMSAGRYSPEVVSGADAYIASLLAAQPSATGRDLKTMMGEEQALYETLGLGTDPEANKAQMLFDIGQAAFQYGSNTGPDGRPMQGSGAARLSQALGPLAGKVGARAGQMSKEGQALKMLALKGAQGKIATAQASDLALDERRHDIAMEVAKQEPASRLLTSADFAMPKYAGLDQTLPWQIDGEGKLSIAGGHVIPPTIVDPYWKKGREGKFDSDAEMVGQAKAGGANLEKLNQLLEIIDEGDINVGILSDMTAGMNRLKATVLNDPEALSIEAQNNYTDMMLGSDVFPLITSLGIGARGLDTPAERNFLIAVMTGSRKMGLEALRALTLFRINREIGVMNAYNESVADGSLNEYFDLGYKKETFEVPDLKEINLTTVAQVRSIEEAKIEARANEEAARRAAGNQ